MDNEFELNKENEMISLPTSNENESSKEEMKLLIKEILQELKEESKTIATTNNVTKPVIPNSFRQKPVLIGLDDEVLFNPEQLISIRINERYKCEDTMKTKVEVKFTMVDGTSSIIFFQDINHVKKILEQIFNIYYIMMK